MKTCIHRKAENPIDIRIHMKTDSSKENNTHNPIEITEKIFPAMGTINSIRIPTGRYLKGDTENFGYKDVHPLSGMGPAHCKGKPGFGDIHGTPLFHKGTRTTGSIPILEEAKCRVLALHEKMDVFSEGSETSQINRLAGISPVAVSEDTAGLIRKSMEFSDLTQGAFDITAGPLCSLWRKAKKEQHLPTVEEIEKCRKLVNYKEIRLSGCSPTSLAKADHTTCPGDMLREMENFGLIRNLIRKNGDISTPDDQNAQVLLPQKGMRIDLGGIAKGYAADESARILLENGCRQFLLDFGGTIVTRGPASSIGIQDPFSKTGTPLGFLKVQDEAVVTSGSYERYFAIGGQRYHHILDPRTGMPSDSGLVQVTLVGQDACMLDALATGIFILGIRKGMPILEKTGCGAIFVTSQGDVLVSENLQEKFQLKKGAS